MNKMTRWKWIIKSTFMGFNKIGSKSCVCKPLQIDYANTISIGREVFIGHYSWLMGSADNNNGKGLEIGDKTIIGHFAHIVANREVVIEDNVLLADRVFISDCSHNYENSSLPVQIQGIRFIKPVRIGEGSWVGENVCICGANVGKHCIVGANSVVTRDIPNYSVAVGCPAKVIKKYDAKLKQWVKIQDE